MAETKYPKPTELDPNTYQEPIEDLVKRAKEEREKKKLVVTPAPKKMASGGKVKSASGRADGCACKGKTRGQLR